MKVIITCSTGKIGSGILNECLKNPSVTEIYALSRRPLADDITSNNGAKLKNIIHTDFETYPESLLDQISGAEVCLWALGDVWAKDPRLIDVTYPMNAANAFMSKLKPKMDGSKPFRFIYVSGMLAEQDQQRSLWIGAGVRRAKGEAELKLAELQRANKDLLEVFIVRPGFVVSSNSSVPTAIQGTVRVIRQDQLALAMIQIAGNGFQNQILCHNDLLDLGMSS